MKIIGGKVDFGLIRETGRIELVKLLDAIPGSKALVWDQQLVGAFGLIGEFSFLKEHDVKKMFYISKDKLGENDIPNIIFLTRSCTKNMDLINEQLRREGAIQSGIKKDFHIWFVPRISLLCEDRLKQHGVHGVFTAIKELNIQMIRFESDLASLELPLCYRDLLLDKDPSVLFHIARALMSLQGIFGIIPNVYGKGAAAKSVFDLMVSMRRELAGIEPQIPPQIDQLILIDRSVDLISPLATQLTYEGLIDQFFEINNCNVKLPSDKFSPGKSEPDNGFAETKSVSLTASDRLFAEIRDSNFSAVGPRLSTEAKDVTSQFDKRKFANSVNEMKQFVQKLPQIQQAKECLAIQTTIAELVQDQLIKSSFRPSLQAEQELIKGFETDKINTYIEESIAIKEPLLKVLRLICLQCVVNCGFKQKVYDFYKKEILQVYGFEHFLSLENLEKAGLLYLQKTKNNYSAIRKTLRLTVDDVNESKPSDISYVHSGYAPLSVRLVEFLQWPGWRAITEVLHVLPGPTLTETQQLPAALRQRRGSGNSMQSSQGDPSTCLVFFIGGCTYAEVSALRFMSRVEQGGPEYIVGTTKMINHNNFIESLMEKMPSSEDFS